MADITKIQLQTSAILDVPIHIYSQDFTFIVNGEEFRTTKIISDLLSPEICKIHLIDPTIDLYTITTKNKGNFTYILNLLKFEEESIPASELPFISEILENFQNKNISVKLPKMNEEVTFDNIFELLKMHEKNQHLYKQYFDEEIEFITKNFFEISEEQEEKLEELDFNTIEQILSNTESLQLRDENQLLSIVNRLYKFNSQYSILYKYVYFSFIDELKIQEFIDIFDINDIDGEIWSSVSNRLKQKIDLNKQKSNNDADLMHHYRCCKPIGTKFECKHDDQFDGIINFLSKESNADIKNVLDITCSSIYGDSQSYSPYNVCLFDNKDKYFHTKDEPNSWICFDFKDHRIMLSNYIIKSSLYGKNSHNPKTWILEGSNDKTNWETLDEQKECPYFNGPYLVHTFDIQKQIEKYFKYIRMKQTGANWYNNKYHYFTLGSIEFYGSLI